MRYSMKKKKEQNSSPRNDGWYCDERRKKVPTFGARARLMISFPSCHIMERQNEKKDKTLTSCLISWREGVKSAKLLSELPSQSNDISFLAKSSGKAWKLYFRNITDVIPNQRLSSSTYWPFYPKIFLCQFYVAHKNLQHFLTFTSLLLLNNVKITAL